MAALTKSICNAMQRIAPLRLAGSWDNVGLLLESPVQHPPSTSRRVLLTIDMTPAVLDEALARGASMIVSYHPPIFSGLKALTLTNPLQATLLRCAAAGISVYSPHTALDSVHGGVNDWLAGCIQGIPEEGLGKVEVLVERKDAEERALGGDGRVVQFAAPISMDVLVGRVKTGLGLKHVQVGYAPTKPAHLVSRVALCAGSGGSMLGGVPADVYLTGEMSHHEVLAALAAGTHVILCGHTNTERGYLPLLAEKLCAELALERAENEPALDHAEDEPEDRTLLTLVDNAVEVLVSERDAHPLAIV
ncbi:NGG1p interacting factor 3 [Mycena rebaudengoi]|nr:NGG1p interacting factor 3 [Mycena rebaudengoi]